VLGTLRVSVVRVSDGAAHEFSRMWMCCFMCNLPFRSALSIGKKKTKISLPA